MTALPDPLTPPGCDLRAFDWFPFYHKRLLNSSFWSRASDQACRISVDFWSIAYEQVPAASLPDDDYLLAEWAGFGRRNVDTWRAVKDEVMEPWLKCADGRWYHPTLSEVACKAWVERRLHLWKRECERVRKDNLRRKEKGVDPLELPPKPSDDPFEDVAFCGLSCGKDEVSAGQTEMSDGHLEESTADPPDFLRTSDGKRQCGAGLPAENALKGKVRETTPSGNRSSSLRSDDARGARSAFDDEFWPKYPHKVGKPAAQRSFEKLWRELRGDISSIIAGLERYCREKPADRPWLNPATFLNQRRFDDEPASPSSTGPAQQQSTPRIDFGGGVSWPEPTVRMAVSRWRAEPATWPADRIGPPPGAPGCKVPERLLDAAA